MPAAKKPAEVTEPAEGDEPGVNDLDTSEFVTVWMLVQLSGAFVVNGEHVSYPKPGESIEVPASTAADMIEAKQAVDTDPAKMKKG